MGFHAKAQKAERTKNSMEGSRNYEEPSLCGWNGVGSNGVVGEKLIEAMRGDQAIASILSLG